MTRQNELKAAVTVSPVQPSSSLHQRVFRMLLTREGRTKPGVSARFLWNNWLALSLSTCIAPRSPFTIDAITYLDKLDAVSGFVGALDSPGYTIYAIARVTVNERYTPLFQALDKEIACFHGHRDVLLADQRSAGLSAIDLV
ncbi:MAG: hypothetical protein H6R25_1028 [Proteobacteria bacterium]|nr:hypothetical protein [Pseudomonadota bacterium]